MQDNEGGKRVERLEAYDDKRVAEAVLAESEEWDRNVPVGRDDCPMAIWKRERLAANRAKAKPEGAER